MVVSSIRKANRPMCVVLFRENTQNFGATHFCPSMYIDRIISESSTKSHSAAIKTGCFTDVAHAKKKFSEI